MNIALRLAAPALVAIAAIVASERDAHALGPVDVEIGARVGVATPNIGALLGLSRLMARTRGLYPPASPNRAA